MLRLSCIGQQAIQGIEASLHHTRDFVSFPCRWMLRESKIREKSLTLYKVTDLLNFAMSNGSYGILDLPAAFSVSGIGYPLRLVFMDSTFAS